MTFVEGKNSQEAGDKECLQSMAYRLAAEAAVMSGTGFSILGQKGLSSDANSLAFLIEKPASEAIIEVGVDGWWRTIINFRRLASAQGITLNESHRCLVAACRLAYRKEKVTLTIGAGWQGKIGGFALFSMARRSMKRIPHPSIKNIQSLLKIGFPLSGQVYLLTEFIQATSKKKGLCDKTYTCVDLPRKRMRKAPL